MKTLIIPDIHLEVKWADEMVQQHQPDRIILLGDYFDPSPAHRGQRSLIAEPGQSADMLIWLAGMIKEYGERIVVLTGNHDAAYLYPEATIQIYFEAQPVFHTSSYSTRVLAEIEKRAAEIALIRSQASWFYYDEASSYLYSHAGVCPQVFADASGTVTLESIGQILAEAMDKARAGAYHPALGIGRRRGGTYPVGGITWLDFNAEFTPVPGFKQIVGHTPQPSGFAHQEGNFCLDGIQQTVATIDDKQLQIVVNNKVEYQSKL